MRDHMLATALAVLALGSCGSPVDVPLIVEGPIDEVEADPPMILVKPASDECGYWFLVDSRTDITITTPSSSASTSPGDSDELRVGVTVRAWADGDVQLSCPAFGRARRVVVVDGG